MLWNCPGLTTVVSVIKSANTKPFPKSSSIFDGLGSVDHPCNIRINTQNLHRVFNLVEYDVHRRQASSVHVPSCTGTTLS